MTAEVRKLAKEPHSTLLLNSLMTVLGLNSFHPLPGQNGNMSDVIQNMSDIIQNMSDIFFLCSHVGKNC